MTHVGIWENWNENEVVKVEQLISSNHDVDDLSKTSLLMEYQYELKNQLSRCKNAQAQYLSKLGKDQINIEIEWKSEVHSIYADVSTKLFSTIKQDVKKPIDNVKTAQQ